MCLLAERCFSNSYSMDITSVQHHLTGAGFDINVARVEGNRHEVQHIPAQAAETEVTEPQYEIRSTPYIFCEWSESIAFQDKTA